MAKKMLRTELKILFYKITNISIPIFAYYEIKRGLLAVGATTKQKLFNKFVKACELIDVTTATFDLASQIYAELKQTGNIIEDGDLFIWCISLRT
jgi:predicted nucleic acid-binding protein